VALRARAPGTWRRRPRAAFAEWRGSALRRSRLPPSPQSRVGTDAPGHGSAQPPRPPASLAAPAPSAPGACTRRPRLLSGAAAAIRRSRPPYRPRCPRAGRAFGSCRSPRLG
jgi:hypothetical protein